MKSNKTFRGFTLSDGDSLSLKLNGLRKAFKYPLGKRFVSGLSKNSFSIFCFVLALFLNASCKPLKPPDHILNDRFSDRRAKTIYDINQFIRKVTVEIAAPQSQSEEKKGEVQERSSTKSNGKSTQKKQVDWIDATLKEEHLKQLGAVRIKTVLKGEEIKNSISQAGTFIDSNSKISFLNQYYRLDYNLLDFQLPAQTNLKEVKSDPQKLWAFLLGKVDKFYGFPDTVYYILPHLEGNYLILYRLGKPETIPYDQIPVARKVGDFLATPLVGYPISYCIPENKDDDYGHITDFVVPNCEGIAAASAKYVEFLAGNRQLFQYKTKLDLFPRDFFNGEWLYFRTVIEAGEEQSSAIGHQPYVAANLVEFHPDGEQLSGKDTSRYELRKEDEKTSVFIPVKWKEYEMDRDLEAFKSFSERENEDTKKEDQPYFSLDYNRLTSIEKGNYSGEFTVNRVLITDNSFHFDIYIHQKNTAPIVIKYSFKRSVDNPDYPQKRWYEEDSTKFHPMLYVERKYYPKATDITEEDEDKFIRVTRFDPNQKEIRWYFSTQTPKDEWVRDFGRLSVELENKAFQEAGKYSDRKITMVLDESEDKELGDIRYNIINMVTTQNIPQGGSIQMGWGPNVSDPITGEVVSATANLWVSYSVDIYIFRLRNYIRFHIWPLPWKLLPTSHGVSDFLHEKIQELCPEVNVFISQYQGVIPPLHPINSAGVLDYKKDKKIQTQCARKLARASILETTIHEIRHGLGFRHIFSASTDVENYYKNYDEIKEIFGEPVWGDGTPVWMDNVTDTYTRPAYFSSVMDYGNRSFPGLSVPGKYDIAATRYAYFDQMETMGNNRAINGLITLAHPAEKSILQEIEEPVLFTNLDSEESVFKKVDKSQIKRYHICGGGKYSEYSDITPDNPFCAKQDYGRTPKEIVGNVIRGIKNTLMNFSRRYDSSGLIPIRGLTGLDIIPPFIGKWAELRKKLFDHREEDPSDYYMSEEGIKEYKKIIQDTVTKHPGFGFFYEVVPLLTDFFKELYNFPLKSCVYQQEDGSYKAVALEIVHAKIKSSYSENSREVLVNCESDVVKKWAEEKNMGTFITEVGVWEKHTEYFVHPREEEDPYSESTPLSLLEQTQKMLLPLIAYEPDIVGSVFEGVKDGILNGVNINPYVDKAALRKRLGLSKEAPLPEFPHFLNYEVSMMRKPAVFPQLMTMLSTINILVQFSSSERIRRQLLLRYNLSAEDPVELQTDISSFIQGREPLQAKSKMFDAYGVEHPFIYKAYTKYLDEYDTPEKRQSTSFMKFFTGLPSVVFLSEIRKLVVPFDENNIFEDIFIRYDEYKNCVEKSTSCEQMVEKRAFMRLVENSVPVWLVSQLLVKRARSR